MNKLETVYAGLKLKNPLIASSSPLTASLEKVKELEEAGIGAVILPSLFEEEILYEEEEFYSYIMEQEASSAEGVGFLPSSLEYENTSERYLSLIESYKKNLTVPVIASLNGSNLDVLKKHAKEIQKAGADALEINLYEVVCKCEQSAADVEQKYIDLLKGMKSVISIPIIVKLSSQFTSIPHFVKNLEFIGIEAISIFNRFYQPNIDLDSSQVKHEIQLSTPYESLRRIRWTAILRDQVTLSIGVTGGMHQSDEITKAILAGSDAIYICSTLFKNGLGEIKKILNALECWLEEKECKSVEQVKGSVSYNKAIDPSSYERAAYVDLISKNNWKL